MKCLQRRLHTRSINYKDWDILFYRSWSYVALLCTDTSRWALSWNCRARWQDVTALSRCPPKDTSIARTLLSRMLLRRTFCLVTTLVLASLSTLTTSSSLICRLAGRIRRITPLSPRIHCRWCFLALRFWYVQGVVYILRPFVKHEWFSYNLNRRAL